MSAAALHQRPTSADSLQPDRAGIIACADSPATTISKLDPAGLRALAVRLRETADRIERRERGERVQ